MDIYDILTENLDMEEFFEQWYKEYESSDNFEERMWYHKDEDVEEWKDDNSYEENEEMDMELKNWMESTLKEKAQDWFNDHNDNLIDSMYNKNLKDGKIQIFRTMTIDDVPSFVNSLKTNNFSKKYDGVGEYWAWDKNKAEAHWSDGKEEILLSGYCEVNDIDLKVSLLKNFCHTLGEDEAELQLHKGHEVLIETMTVVKSGENFSINSLVKI